MKNDFKRMKKVQQMYIENKFKKYPDPVAWFEHDGCTFITIGGATVHSIPTAAMHIALEPAENENNLKRHITDYLDTCFKATGEYKELTFDNTTPEGYARFKFVDNTGYTYLDPKKLNEFKGISDCVFYAANNKRPVYVTRFAASNVLGMIMPMRYYTKEN